MCVFWWYVIIFFLLTLTQCTLQLLRKSPSSPALVRLPPLQLLHCRFFFMCTCGTLPGSQLTTSWVHPPSFLHQSPNQMAWCDALETFLDGMKYKLRLKVKNSDLIIAYPCSTFLIEQLTASLQQCVPLVPGLDCIGSGPHLYACC